MKKSFYILLVLLLTASAYAQTYNLKYNFKEGNTYVYSDVTNNDITQEMMGSEMKVVSNARTLIRLLSEKNSADEITFLFSIDSAVAETKTPQMDTTMVLDNIIGKKMRMTINKKGEIISQEMIDSVDVGSQMMQMGQKEAMQFSKLPDNDVKIGEKWTVNKTDTLDMMGGKTVMTSEMEFTLFGKEEKMGYQVLKIPFTAKIKIEGTGSMMGFEFFLEGGGNSKGEFYFNPDEGIPVYTEASQSFDVTMAATGDQNMIIPISQQMKTTRSLVK